MDDEGDDVNISGDENEEVILIIPINKRLYLLK